MADNTVELYRKRRGYWLRVARTRAGLTLKEVALELGYSLRSATTIKLWEDGLRDPSDVRLRRLAEVYRVPVEVFTDPDITDEERLGKGRQRDRPAADIDRSWIRTGVLPTTVPGSIAPRPGGQHWTVIDFTDTRSDAAVEVVGEQYHANAIARFIATFGTTRGQAVIGREPDNPEDANAIAVYAVLGPELDKIGYLLREDALAYGPVFTLLDGPIIRCDAAVAPRRGGGGTDGIVLHLGTPGELVAEIWNDRHPAPPDHPWSGKTVAFTGFGLSLAGVTLDRPGQTRLAMLVGCIPVPRVTKKVSLCVAHNLSEVTGNVLKAREYGVPIVDEREFWISVGIPADALGAGLGPWARPERQAWGRA